MATATIPEFRNEPYADFSQPANRQAMEAALAKVRSEFGREYQLRIGGEWIATGDRLVSVNPSNSSEVVGIHHKATAGTGESRGGERLRRTFRKWSRTPAEERVRLLLDAARILRARKLRIRRVAGLRGRQDVARGRSGRLPKRSTSANTTRARCSGWRARSRWCNFPASRTRWSTSRWASAW